MSNIRLWGWRLASVFLALSLVACGWGSGKSPTLAETQPPAETLPPTPLPTWTPVPSPIPHTLYIDAEQNLGPISPYIYGVNYGPWAMPSLEMLPLAEKSAVTYLRFPAGEWGDQYDLKDYHIDRFIAFARKLSAEPKINVRMPGGTPEQAAELVRYCNVENDYNVRYWAIGNEPSLYSTNPAYEDFDTERYNRVWREFAEAMKAVDPNIILIGPETHQYTGDPDFDPKDEHGRDWVREFLLANGDMVDIVSIHRYPFPLNKTGTTQTIDDLRQNSREWDTIIPNLRTAIRETTGRDLPVAVSEINSDWTHTIGGEATNDSFYNAIWWADVLGRMIRQKVEIVAYFTLSTYDSQGGYGLVAKYETRPTYYVYQMYQHFGENLVYSSSDDPDLSIYAAQREDSALTVMIINLGPEEKQTPLRIDGRDTSGSAEVWLFDAEHQAEQVESQTLVSGDIITLPSQSITLYVFP